MAPVLFLFMVMDIAKKIGKGIDHGGVINGNPETTLTLTLKRGQTYRSQEGELFPRNSTFLLLCLVLRQWHVPF